MKGTYITIEIILIAALLRFGEKVGTNNMWFVIVAIIVSHFVMEFLYELRLYSETHKLRSKKKSNTHNNTAARKPTSHNITNTNKTSQPVEDTLESILDSTLKLDIDVDADTAKRDFFKMDIS